ncbi:MAG: GNAT family N-acetyltransferase, partial [Fimbriimonadaceae bacterium]|nr:GNAT family N-acetyltransferase [Alphaproteobacteria bacterium]
IQSSMTKNEKTRARVEQRISAIDRDAWQLCATNSSNKLCNPFISYDFLDILEESGCVAADTGWLPQHIVIEDKSGAVAACMPCYIKGHSQGEYVFDHAWADALERAGGQYYPKLQISSPFSPVTGPRMLVRPGEDVDSYRAMLAGAAVQLMEHYEASSVHMTFLPEDEARFLESQGFLTRNDQQFHWFNDGYGGFEDFLESLSARKRKTIRRERRGARENDISIEWITGSDLREEHWDAFFAFYLDTGTRKWGRPYLNRTFFSLLGARMAKHTLLIMAKRDGKYIAGALNILGDNAIFGRHWGCVEDHPFLHFEICYYQAIDYAIEHGLGRVEAGAQGPHKLARGYLPVTTHSVHFIAHSGLRDAVAHHLRGEREHVAFESRILARHSPYRKGQRSDRTSIRLDLAGKS